jgi:hypothetical protein
MKKFCQLTIQNSNKNMWKFLTILNFIVVIFLIEFYYSWSIVERLIFYSYGIFTLSVVFKTPNWKPYFLIKRGQISKFTLKDLITKIKRMTVKK